ncbi:MAG: arginyltransferase, partial [Gammaproteobacteria bacterium]
MSQETRIDLYLTPDHECGYFQDRRASSLVVDPQLRPDQDTFTLLTRQGFRRSGSHIYRPHCAECSACHPMRVDVAHFKPNRSQRRCAQRFKDLSVTKVKPEYSEEQFLLFERYIQSRHAGGGMDEDITPESYSRFL